jgi:hypothetical protein
MERDVSETSDDQRKQPPRAKDIAISRSSILPVLGDHACVAAFKCLLRALSFPTDDVAGAAYFSQMFG